MHRKDLLTIHTSRISPRLQFVNYVVFELLLGLDLEYSPDQEDFEQIKGPKINYSHLKIENSLHIVPDELLFETEIKAHQPSFDKKGNFPLLFLTQGGDLPFDLLAASFYIISRYEEYNSQQLDAHQRFPAHASIQNDLKVLDIPIVQIWAHMLKDALVEKFPNLKCIVPTYSFTPTFDIDMAWSYKEKGWYRMIGASLKSLLQLNLTDVQKRWNTINGSTKDPFDTFEYLSRQCQQHGLKPIYFFLVAKHSEYDKNTSPANQNFMALIKKVSQKNKVGIHPSYYSEQYLEAELNTLHSIVDKPITHSRQHYVRLKFPETYRRLLAQNIHADYSMGYPDRLGFRNGLSIPTPWYDLEKEVQTSLIIHPFQIMDVTLKNYLQYDPELASKEVRKIIDTCKKYGGSCIPIWHNSSFDHQWQGWEKVFEEMLSYARY